jgi:DNA-binding transcriptional regulator GbsR (MarR family)
VLVEKEISRTVEVVAKKELKNAKVQQKEQVRNEVKNKNEKMLLQKKESKNYP